MDASLAATTIHTRVKIVRTALRATVADRIIAGDPSEGVALPRFRTQEGAMKIPTVEQVAALIEGTTPDFAAFVAVGAFAGLRPGEIAGLQVGDIDFLRRQLRVSRQLQRDGREVAVVPPKYGSERTVYLPDELLTMLSDHIAAYAPERWLFTSAGKPLHNNAVTFRWRSRRRCAGCAAVTLRSLRHFFASGLIADGCDVVTVQRALGHKSATITVSYYAHLWSTAEERTRRASGRLAVAVLSGDRSADSLRTETHG